MVVNLQPTITLAELQTLANQFTAALGLASLAVQTQPTVTGLANCIFGTLNLDGTLLVRGYKRLTVGLIVAHEIAHLHWSSRAIAGATSMQHEDGADLTAGWLVGHVGNPIDPECVYEFGRVFIDLEFHGVVGTSSNRPVAERVKVILEGWSLGAAGQPHP